MYAIRPTDALVVVDPQNDFLPGGALPVGEGERIFEPVGRVMPLFAHVFATRDWHPPHHSSFQAQGGPWPEHCVAGSHGAAFSPLLPLDRIGEIVDKGTDPATDGYSGFAGTDLAARLRARGVDRVFICGLATDYCVKETAIAAAGHGFATVVLTDAIAAVNAQPGDEAAALQAMETAGARFATSADLHAAA
ncbi:MAG: nicotinamidase [Vulcanimicrobiaceae bacterium]|nr:nicotinamidase [Bacillota bacterium]